MPLRRTAWEYGVCSCSSEKKDEVLAALTTVVTASRAEPGCVSIHAFTSVRDPQLFFIHSVWKDASSLDLLATLPHTVEFINTVDGLLDEPREVARTSYLGWPRRKLHSPRAARMKVTPPSPPSAQSVQTKKKPPVDLAISP